MFVELAKGWKEGRKEGKRRSRIQNEIPSQGVSGVLEESDTRNMK